MQIILDVVSTVGYYSIFPVLVITPAAIVIGLILHNTLITRLDPLLFQEAGTVFSSLRLQLNRIVV